MDLVYLSIYILYAICIYILFTYATDSYKIKYQRLINKQESLDLGKFNNSKAFVEHSKDTNNIYENIEEDNRI